jgi:DsbE subfamily thiol:disulfide oxidoreductase
VACVPRRCLSVLVLLCVAVLSAACGRSEAVGGVARKDEPLPRLVGETLEGEPLDAAVYGRGEVLVINVWADWCDPCRREQPMLVRLAEAYEGRGVRFLGINYQDDRHAARAWVEAFGVPYPSLFDRSGRTAVDLGFPALPDTYVVDRGGTIRWVVFGETDEEELGGLIDDVLS